MPPKSNVDNRYMGKPCKRGHSGLRYKCNGVCCECVYEDGGSRQRKFRATEKGKTYSRNYMWKKLGMPDPTRPRPEVCGCCGKPDLKQDLSLDHDHKTGEFRGWLCNSCNLAIGRLGDTIERVRNALEYLLRASGGTITESAAGHNHRYSVSDALAKLIGT